MRNNIFFCLFLVIITFGKTAVARSGSISGRVSDEAGKPVPFASILLIKTSDSSLVSTELTNEKGEYGLTPIKNGVYFLRVMLSGYETYNSGVLTVTDNSLPVPKIVLHHPNISLQEVAVTVQKPFIETHPDKIVVNVENSIVSAGSSVMDVLQRSPGISVDQNDNISLKGKSGVNITINGKTQPLDRSSLANLLKSMPSGSVEAIEITANPSAKFDAAGTAGIINIRMKKDNKKGLNGSVNTSYAQGIYAKGNAGVNMNYRNKRINLFANLNHSERTGFNHLSLNRRFYSDNVFSGAYIQDNHFINTFGTTMGSFGADYNLTAKTVVGVVLSGNYVSLLSTGNNHADIIDSTTAQPSARFSTISKAPDRFGNYAANINLRHNFDSAGRTLSVDIDYAGYPNKGRQDYTTTYNDLAGAVIGMPATLYGERWGLTQIESFKADYVHPLQKEIKIEAGVKSSYVVANNNPRFFNLVGNNYILDVTKTDHFIYDENINAAYCNIAKDWSKWGAQIGLRAEQTIAVGDNKTTDTSFDRNYINFFPSLALQRHINAVNDLGITLSRRIERPNYQQLNPFKYYLDPTTYTEGFPYLEPALSYSAALSHTFRQKFITTLSYIVTYRPLTEVIQPSETEAKITVQTTKNLTRMNWYGASGSYQFRFNKWWNNTSDVNVYYANYIGDIAGTSLNKGNVTFDVNTTNGFILARNWSAELSFFYQAPQVYGYMDLEPTWMLNAGIQRNLFNKQATLRVNVTDIFWHGYPRATSYYNNYIESFVAERDTRQAGISFVYRFGNRNIPPSMRHSGGAEDEKKRIGTQGG